MIYLSERFLFHNYLVYTKWIHDMIKVFIVKVQYMLRISTSQRVLSMPFAGQNELSEAKTIFSVTNGTK